MNVVREINKINELELKLGTSTASWHDEYKDSAYIYVGGLHFDLTEGDVITIFSQYGEVMDVNLPRDKETGKTRGFGFLMYEDQRSTILAVDNLNGAKVLEKTLRVDHVKSYKQPKSKNEDGEWVEPEGESFNARPKLITDGDDGDHSDDDSDAGSIDPEDPMRDYLLEQRREQKALKKGKDGKKNKKHKKHIDETPEERRARKARKKEKKAKKSEGMKGVEALLQSLGGPREGREREVRSTSKERSRRYEDGDRMRSRSPRRDDLRSTKRHTPSPPRRNRQRDISPRYGNYDRDYSRRENYPDRDHQRRDGER